MENEQKPKKHRFKKAYTVHIISDSPDATTRQYHFNAGMSQVLILTGFLLFLAVVCYIIYSAMSLHALTRLQERQSALTSELQAQNAQLAATNNALQNEVTQLSRAINQRLEADAQAQEEAHALTVPKGFPLTGSASMRHDTYVTADGTQQPMLFFEGIEAGSAVIATGSGTVTEVASDERYGYRIAVSHNDGYTSVYLNGGVPLVSLGDEVAFAAELFRVAQGNAYLGYQVLLNGQAVDPETILEING